MKKNVIYLLTIILLINCFVGCGQQNNVSQTTAAVTTLTEIATTTTTTATTQTTKETVTETQTTQAPAAEGPYMKFPEPVTVTGALGWTAGINADLDFEDNPWTRLYLEKYNIIIKYLWIVDESQYKEKVNLSIASGEIPDFIKVSDTQFQQMYDAGMTTDVQDVYEKFTTDTTKQFIIENGQGVIQASSRGGRMHAIPYTVMRQEAAPILMVDNDWLTKTGVNEINSINDFETFLKNASDNKLGGVSYSLPEDKDLVTFKYLAAMYKSYPDDFWVTLPDNTLAFGAIQPETKDALIKFQEWYQKGWLDPEFGTKDWGKLMEDAAAGRMGIFPVAFWGPLGIHQAYKNNQADFDLTMFEIPCIEGKVTLPYQLALDNYWVTNPGCKYPEAFPLMLNSWMEIFYTSTDPQIGREYINAEDGSQIWTYSYAQAYRAYKNYDQSVSIQNWLDGKEKMEDLTADTKNVAQSIEKYLAGDNSMWAWYKIYGPKGSFSVIEKYLSNKQHLMTSFYGPTTETMADKKEILKKLMEESFTRIIRGSDINEFDEFVKQWNDLGGAEITREVNEWNKNK